MVKSTTILAFIAIIVVIGFGLYMAREPACNKGGWHCTEEGCKFVKGKDGHSTEEDCSKACSTKDKPQGKKVTFSPET